MKLYPDQQDFVAAIREAFRGHQSVLAQAATGFGKTVVSAFIAKNASAKGNTVYFTTHRKNLIRQTQRTFRDWGIPHGVIAAGVTPTKALVQVVSIDTLRRRLDKIKAPCDLMVVDECHLACSPTWSEVLRHYKATGTRLLGNSATPARLDLRPLSEHFDVMVHGPSVRSLIDAGRLSDYRLYAPSSPSMDGVRTRMGEYVGSDLESVMGKQIVGDSIQHYRQLMPGKRALAFCVSIKHSQLVAEQFCAAGIPAAHVDGTTLDDERNRVIGDFADGRISVLCNCELVTVGFDLAAQVGRDVPVQGAIMLRPTQSVVLWLQMIGRAMRAKKEPAIILDHTGNSLRLSCLPDDEREWSLTGQPKQTKEAAVSLRACPVCFATYRAFLPRCPVCGKEREVEVRLPETVDGQLSEVDVAAMRAAKKREEGSARTLEDLVRLAKRRGYEAGWAGIKFAVRTGTNRALAIANAYKLSRELVD